MLPEPANTRSAGAGSIVGDPFYGGGEAGAILRKIDWAKKPIGPVAGWPQSLRTALSIGLASRHPICIIWGPERLYFYNDAYAPIVGAKHPWALGESYITVWPEIWDSAIRPILEKVEATGEASWEDDLLLVLRRHGYNEECYFAFSFAPTRIEDGSVGGVFTAITETTSQVVGERRLRTLRDLGARGPDAKSAEEACRIAHEVLAENPFDVPFTLFYVIDADGKHARLTEVSELASDSAAAPSVVGLAETDGDDVWGFREAIAAGKPLVRTGLTERFGVLAAGPWPEPVHTAVVLPIVRPGEPVPYGFMVAGVSPRRQLDNDYQSFLGLAAGQVASAVSNARAYAEERRRAEALAELDRAKTDFFSNVSHEFRTPLTLMLGPLEELLGAELAPEVREQLQVAHRNSLRLLKLVNALLDFSRIEAGRINASYEPVDLAELTTELSSVFRAAIERAGLSLIVACQTSPEPAFVDRDMWEKIVFNLLSNAYKFTRRGEILVELRTAADRFELAVRDTGTGIAPEHQEKVFQRFQRVENEFSRTHEGTGIGLALVQELARMHGGSVALESTLGEGSTFTVRIPRGQAHLPADRINAGRELAATTVLPAAFVEESLRWRANEDDAVSASVQAERTMNGSRVLLADDNADMREYVQRLLGERYDVRAVGDGAEALRVAREWQPDLVLSDVMMPGLNGFELTRALREETSTRAIPVILLSARAGEESRIEGLDAGADDYLIKPFGARELLARVHTNLHMADVRRDAAAQVSASEARFEQLVSVLPVGVCVSDAEGRVTFSNRRAAEIWGCEPMLGEHYDEFAARFATFTLAGERVPQELRPVHVALTEGRAVRHGEHLVERPDGSRFVASFTVAPTLDAGGRVTGTIAVFQDITEERRARTALRESEERYRAVFQQASVGIFECDLEGRIVRSNPALSRLLGYTNEELVGRNWRDLVPSEDREPNGEVAQQLAQGKLQAFTAERRYVRKDGTTGWLDVFATTILDEHGGVARGLAVLVDVSERKRAAAELRETEARFRAAADNAPVLIWMAAADKSCEWVNQPWLDFVGMPLAEMLSTGWAKSVHPEDEARTLRAFDWAFEARQPFSMEYRLRRHDGVYRWVLSHGVPRHQGAEFAGYIGSCVDIEDRKRAETEVARARDEAVAASRAKDDFLAALSHELRTPLSPVLLLASEAAVDPALPPLVRADFDTIRKSIELEARLIDDLLDLTRITRGKLVLDVRTIDVHMVLEDAFATVRAEFAAKQIEVGLDLGASPREAMGDPVRLQQVFWNVLKNAVKFTPPRGRVAISTRKPAEREVVIVEITDTGIGITPEELGRVFEAFSQGDHAKGGGSHRFGGLGLGLAISRRVVELHGGRMDAESAGRDRGARFRIELPLSRRGAEARTPARAEPPVALVPREESPPSLAGRILLVEDNAPTRTALERLLRRRNYAVRSAASAAEARAWAEQETFDLLISDIGLPDGSGYALMNEFRERHGLKGIALTGYGMEDDVLRSETAGFVVHLTKPIRMQALEKALATVAGK